MVPGSFRRASSRLLAVSIAAAAFTTMRVAASRPAMVAVPVPAIDIPAEHLLQPGDLIFRRGRDFMSGIVLAQREGASFSHVGIVVREGTNVLVIHAIPADGTASVTGVVKEPLETFAASDIASAIAIYRLPLASAERQAVQSYALRQIGKPFDTAFAMSDDISLYCTELAVKALRAGGHKLARLETLTSIVVAEPVITPDALAAHPSLALVTAAGT